MSAPLRFLALVVVGWAGLRLAGGGFPEASLGSPVPAAAAASTIVPTEFAPLPPVASAAPPAAPIAPAYYPAYYPAAPAPYAYAYPAYYPAPVRQASLPIPARRGPLTDIAPIEGPIFYAPIKPIDQWPLEQIAQAGLPTRRSAPVPIPAAPVPAQPKLDRLQLTAWALLRDRSAGTASGGLASGGTLGGSQAGMRLTYAVTRTLAASLRTTSPVGYSGAEIAAGIRYQPLRSLPVWITAERRQAIGRNGGRSAFAMFAESGLYGRPVIGRFELDAYAQGGVVGARSRDLFVDGAFTLTRPVFRNYSAGFGVWGGAQPGLYRVDAGPRVSMRVRGNMRVHVDWRQRLAGTAVPGSGPALTLAGDF